ncbi:MAG: Cu(+)/Ag(+) sensor histidine kinase [Paralcaligenes sp.]
MSQRPASLALRLTLLIGIVITLVFLVFGWIIGRSINHHFAEQDAGELNVVAGAVQRALHSPTTGENPAALEHDLGGAVSGHHGVFFQVIDSKGNLLYASPGADLSVIARALAPSANINVGSLHSWTNQGKSYRGAVVAVAEPDGKRSYTLAVAISMDFHLRYLDSLQRSLWLTTIIIWLIAIFAVWLAVYKGLAPIRHISANIRGITSKRLDVRLVPNSVPIELADLITSFNGMIERIENVFHRLSNFSADLAHELRTPITNLTTQTEVALNKARSVEQYRETLYSNLEEYERMTKMVSDMLFLAQADNHFSRPELVNIDLTNEIHELFDYFEAWAEERHVVLSLQGVHTELQGDRPMIRRALSNLLSNAIRYTPPHQSVTVVLESSLTAVVIRVVNPGPEISTEHLEKIFDRFYRVDASRQRAGNGAGLGLAIAKSIIDAHNGTITAKSCQGVTTFEVTLPKDVLSQPA